MATESTFRGIILFLDRIGVYDVILPFLLIFTIMYAILEKTRVLGEDTFGGIKYSKKNLNSIVAFVIGFLVVASAKLVALVNEAMANIVVLALVGVCVLMLVGVFAGSGEFKFKEDSWPYMILMLLMILGTFLIFLNAIKMDSGDSLLEWSYDFMYDNWDSDAVGAILLLGLVALFIWYITAPGSGEAVESKKEEKA